MSIKMMKRAFIATFLVFLWGCDELNFTDYTIVYPEKGKTYIGTPTNQPPINDGVSVALDQQFQIAYKNPPSSEINIVLNGHNVGHLFDLLADKAVVDISEIQQFFRHGENTLSVEPLAFGPSINFYLDAHGPTIVIKEGKLNGTQVTIDGYVRDFSPVGSTLQLQLININGYYPNGALNTEIVGSRNIAVNEDGTFSDVVSVDGLLAKPLLYSFTAQDIYGYSSKKEFLADGNGTQAMPLENAVRVAVGGSFVEALRPIIASSIYSSLLAAPIDVRDVAWNDPGICVVNSSKKRGVVATKAYTQIEYESARQKLIDAGNATPSNTQIFAEIKSCGPLPTGVNDLVNCDCPGSSGNDGSVFPNGLNPIKVNIGLGDMPTTLKQFFMNDGTKPKPSGAGPVQRGTMILNSFELRDNNQLALDLVITEMQVALSIDGGWFLGTINLSLSMDRIFVNTVAIASTVNKAVDIQLDDGQSNFQIDGIASSNITIWGINFSGLANLILPALEGVIADMLPGILNPILRDNLQRITIGGVMTQPENQTSFDMRLDIAEMKTDSIFMENDLIVALESTVKMLVPDDNINSMLGPVFYNDPIDPTEVYNALSGVQGTNLTVALNTNLINQSLNAVYGAGVTHFTMHNGTTYYGGNPETPVDPGNPMVTTASLGDTRIRLWPDMPPAMRFSETGKQGEGRAAIEYESAVLALDTLRKNGNGDPEWQTDLELQVNFDLAVGISENEGTFTMRAAGPPVFQINSMKNRSNIQIPKPIIQGVLDVAMTFGGDVLADRFIVLNLGELAAQGLNGTEVRYLSAEDNWTLGANQCITYENGLEIGPSGAANTGDDKYDLICHTINLYVSTDVVRVAGAKGGNLFFQMTTLDADAPPAPAIPRFDLDEDGVIDYRDNCAMPTGDLAQLVAAAGGVAGNLQEDGTPKVAFHNAVRSAANTLLATRYGGSPSASPQAADITHYNNMRTGDAQITSGNWGSYPWLKVMFYNPSQINLDRISSSNPDGDRIGDLCENDDDRDGIWASYDGLAGYDDDNCPYIANPGQEDTLYPPGVGDACNVRKTFVLLRSLDSAQGGTPLCLTHTGVSNSGWVSNNTLRNMVACDPDDAGQRWYLKARNSNDLNAGVEFYTNETRSGSSASRLAAYGKTRSWDYGNKETRVDELRLVNVTDSVLNSNNDDSVSACVVWPCDRSEERADPIWWPTPAEATNNFEESTHPWYIKTNFNFNFANSGWTNIGANSCITYSSGWGADIGSQGDQEWCQLGARWRWAIWVGGTDSPWNGEW